MKIAYFSPLPPQKSGIARYSANLLPQLAELADVVLFAGDPGGVDARLQEQFTFGDLREFSGPLQGHFDMCLYQMGNHIEFHEGIYQTLRRFPGIVVLHDLYLHSFFGELHLRRGDFASYAREMAYAYGLEGLRHARLARQGLIKYDTQRYPLLERVANLSLGVIVNSNYAKTVVGNFCPHVPVAHINQPVPAAEGLLTAVEAKAKLGLDPNGLLLTSFGYVAEPKRVEVAIRSLARLVERFPQLQYVLVGKVVDGYNLESLLAELKLKERVKMVGYADPVTYRRYLAATDIGINLRYPTHGETSATMLDLMAAGKPVLVSNVDAFIELPDPACVKVDVGPWESAQLDAFLQALLLEPELRQRIGANAAAFVSQSFNPSAIARQYLAFIRETLQGIGA